MSGECDDCSEHTLDCMCHDMVWIKCSERMPPKDQKVLCLYLDEYMDVMEYWHDDEESGQPIFFCPPSPPNGNVTHWMSLPLKPKE